MSAELFERWYPLAVKMAERFRRARLHGADIDDLHQVARLALHRASLTYDPSICAFSTYAHRAISRALSKEIQTRSCVVNVLSSSKSAGRFWVEMRDEESVVRKANACCAMPVVVDRRPLPDELASRSERSARLKRAVEALSAKQRDIVLRCAMEEDRRQIAQDYGLSLQRVSQIWQAGLKKVRKLLDSVEPSSDPILNHKTLKVMRPQR